MKKSNLLLLIGAFAALLAGCDNSPRPALTATPAPVATAVVAATPSTVPTNPPPVATETPCTSPAVTGKLNLLPLPGIVRGPAGMAMFQGHLYVAGSRSNNFGVIDNGQLSSVFATGEGPSALAADEATGKLFVLNAGEMSVSMSDGQKVQATIPISNTALAQLHQEAREMVIDAERHRLYVGINTSRPEIAVIDTQAFTISSRIVFTGSHHIGPMALDAANNRLFFAHSDVNSDNISVLNLQTRQITDKIAVGTGPGAFLQYDATSHRLYADYTDRNPGYHVVTLENGKQIASFAVDRPQSNALIVNQRLYTPNVFSNTVDVVDLQTGQPVASIGVGLYPIALLADPGGERLYITEYGILNYAPESNRVEVIDTRRNEVVGLIPLAATTPQMIGDATRNRLYVLLPSSSEVVISDGQRILSRVKLERAPFQMALDDRAGRLYVGDDLAHIISVIDVTSGQVVARITPTLRTVMGDPASMYALAVDSLRDRLLVSNAYFPLDQLRATGNYTISGTPIGEPSWSRYWLASALVPRYFAVSGSGLKISQMLSAYDSESLKPQDTGIADVTALALNDSAQQLYAASTMITSLTSTENALHVLDASTLYSIAQQGLPARVTAMAPNEKTQHLFLAFHGDAAHPSAADDSVEFRDMRTFLPIGTFRVVVEPSAMAFLGDNLYIASSTAADLTIVRDCPLAVPPPPTRTPLPTPSPAPTSTPFPTLTAAPPTPVKPITSWRTYTNTTMGYRISYPNTWYLEKVNPSNVFITSYPPPSFRGTGAVKIDVLVGRQQSAITVPSGRPFCVDGQCGSRVDESGPFTEPINQSLNRSVAVLIPKAGLYYSLSAIIQDPPDAARRNAVIVERIIASFHFTHP
jgi:YVTN family beta-propeller protein